MTPTQLHSLVRSIPCVQLPSLHAQRAKHCRSTVPDYGVRLKHAVRCDGKPTVTNIDDSQVLMVQRHCASPSHSPNVGWVVTVAQVARTGRISAVVELHSNSQQKPQRVRMCALMHAFASLYVRSSLKPHKRAVPGHWMHCGRSSAFRLLNGHDPVQC